MIWFQFAICTAAILYSGSRLSLYGDVIAEKTGMGRTWIGVVLMASVTSLPELVTGISSVAFYLLPNIAAGDVLGSCMFNLLLLAILDIGRNGAPISAVAHRGHVLTAAFGILLLGVAAMSILARDLSPAVGSIGVSSVALLLVYCAAMRLIFHHERKRVAEFLEDVAEETRYGQTPLPAAYRRFAIHAAVIVAAATYLPHLGDRIAEITGMGRTFVGSTFIALSTSLPEVVVTRSALRLGAVDLAVGNVLGSNLFNMAILALDDVFFRPGPLLSLIAPSHAATAVSAMIMTAIVTIALSYRSRRKFFLFSPESLSVMALYALTSVLLYRLPPA